MKEKKVFLRHAGWLIIMNKKNGCCNKESQLSLTFNSWAETVLHLPGHRLYFKPYSFVSIVASFCNSSYAFLSPFYPNSNYNLRFPIRIREARLRENRKRLSNLNNLNNGIYTEQ